MVLSSFIAIGVFSTLFCILSKCWKALKTTLRTGMRPRHYHVLDIVDYNIKVFLIKHVVHTNEYFMYPLINSLEDKPPLYIYKLEWINCS